jgi:hypothetical protein
MDEDPQFKVLVREVIMQLIRSRNTDSLSKRMQEEILPEMIRLTPQIRNKLDLDKLLGESLKDDQNPEWQEIFEDTPGLKDKIPESERIPVLQTSDQLVLPVYPGTSRDQGPGGFRGVLLDERIPGFS